MTENPTIFTKAPELHSSRTTPSIYWSPTWKAPGDHGGQGGHNSYVLLAVSPERATKQYWGTPEHFLLDGQPVEIMSINGRGQHRWEVPIRDIRSALEYLTTDPERLNQPWRGDFVEHYKVFKHFQQYGLTLPVKET